MNRSKTIKNKEPDKKVDFYCVMRDKYGNPICFMKKENTQPNFQNDRALDRKLKAEFLSLQIARSNRYFLRNNNSEQSPQLAPREQNQKFFEQLMSDDIWDLSPKEDHAAFLNHHIEGNMGGPDKPDMDPVKDFPGEDINYPEEDEILDDEPLRDIEEPVEEEFEDDDIPSQTPRIDKMGDDGKEFL